MRFVFRGVGMLAERVSAVALTLLGCADRTAQTRLLAGVVKAAEDKFNELLKQAQEEHAAKVLQLADFAADKPASLDRGSCHSTPGSHKAGSAVPAFGDTEVGPGGKPPRGRTPTPDPARAMSSDRLACLRNEAHFEERGCVASLVVR